jgi:hypothetical protein
MTTYTRRRKVSWKKQPLSANKVNVNWKPLIIQKNSSPFTTDCVGKKAMTPPRNGSGAGFQNNLDVIE